MTIKNKTPEELTVDDLTKFPVWEFIDDDETAGETVLRPVKRIPVRSMQGKIVGSRLILANGDRVWGVLGNIDLKNPGTNQHFLTISILKDGHWFSMARYHDSDSDKRGPLGLARFLNLGVDGIFPIEYNISAYCVGNLGLTSGFIPKEPSEKLTRSELIELSIQ